MSTSKYFDRICVIVTIIALVITTLFMFGEKLGIQKIVDEHSEGYEALSGFTNNDMNSGWDDAEATRITLCGDSAEISGDGAYWNDGNIVIANAGKYVVSGSLSDGSIVVDAYDSSKVFIKLAGVSVYCSDDAAFRVDQADKVFLTLANGSDNSFESGSVYSENALADNTGGTVFSHDDLTINGDGSLTITASYKHGIDCNDKLVIAGGNITVTAPNDGLHANDGINITDTTLTVNAADDGINGGESVLIAGGSINISGCYEGIEAVTVEINDG
ncbi:MAG: carbohydrate-binding domain-containing protein, partial [Lachnospiraceae bacterium]|nr:carbohydrate-binding domain-containing protein [Lachnospiraceae bacterium]